MNKPAPRILATAAAAAALAAIPASATETIAYWPFGTNGFHDVSGNGHDLASTTVTETDDGYITLDGTNAAKSIMHDTYLTLDSSAQDLYFAEVANLTFSKLVHGIGKVPPLEAGDVDVLVHGEDLERAARNANLVKRADLL